MKKSPIKKESNILADTQLKLSNYKIRAFRNNIGAAINPHNGNYIQYGVGGVGGSDLICIIPTVITPAMVGRTLGVFGAFEGKTETGKATKDQLRFIDMIIESGGVAGVIRSFDDTLSLLIQHGVINPESTHDE